MTRDPRPRAPRSPSNHESDIEQRPGPGSTSETWFDAASAPSPGSVVCVNGVGVGVLDEAGRLRLLGAGATGAAFAVVLVVLVASSWAEPTPALLVGLGVPAAAVGIAIAVVLQRRSWRAEGGYERSVVVRNWVLDGEVPPTVPAAEWIPLVQAQADREVAGWGKIVLSTIWILMTWSMRDQHGPVITTMLILLWIGLGLWSALWVIPRARAAKRLLGRGGATPT